MDFSKVVPGDHVPNDCTPRIPRGFVGVRINAPRKVVRGTDQFVICGVYRFPAAYLEKFASVNDTVVLVAVDSRGHRPRASNLWAPGETPDPVPPQPFEEPDWISEHFVESYFNVNLLDLLPDLAGTSADLFVYALIEDHVSNVVRVTYRT